MDTKNAKSPDAVVQDFINFLYTVSASKMSQSSRRDLITAINANTKRIREQTKRVLHVGQKVEWTDKYGYTKNGVITAVNRTCCKVRADTGMPWRVSITLLRPVKG